MRDEISDGELDALIAAEYAALRCRVEERLAPLLAERALRDRPYQRPHPFPKSPPASARPTIGTVMPSPWGRLVAKPRG